MKYEVIASNHTCFSSYTYFNLNKKDLGYPYSSEYIPEVEGFEKRRDLLFGILQTELSRQINLNGLAPFINKTIPLDLDSRIISFLLKVQKSCRKLRQSRARQDIVLFKSTSAFQIATCSKHVGSPKEVFKHSFGRETIKKGPWKIICHSFTETRLHTYCDSYSFVSIKYEDIEIKIDGGLFRDGTSEHRDNPENKLIGIKIIDVTDTDIFFAIEWQAKSMYMKAYLNQ